MKCPNCNASTFDYEDGRCPCGYVIDDMGRPYLWVVCPSCDGRGSYMRGCDYCRQCGGSGGHRDYFAASKLEVG